MSQSINTVENDIHGHILLMYSDQKQRLRVLAEYFDEGLTNNELCVLVTPDPPKKVLKDFLAEGLDARKAFDKNKLRIFEMTASYLPHGKFAANYMLQNVVNFILDAKSRGYSGVRTAGEMSWLYDNQEFIEEADKYERQVNELNNTNPEFTGLCMYPVREGTNDIVDGALHTHPSYMFDGTARTNPFSATAGSR